MPTNKRRRKTWYIKTVIAHPPLYMWCQSGELGETDYGGHSRHSLFQYECVSTNQNGMLLVIAAYITQYVSLLVCVAFIM